MLPALSVPKTGPPQTRLELTVSCLDGACDAGEFAPALGFCYRDRMRGHDEDSANALRIPIRVLRAVNEAELPPRGAAVLFVLASTPSGTAPFQDIMRESKMGKAQLTRACESLENAGMVKRSTAKFDLRVTIVSITPDGRNAVERFKKAYL